MSFFHLYGLIVGIAVLASIWVIERREKKLDHTMIWFTLTGAIVGARLYHLFTDWSVYRHASFIEILAIWNGGLGIFGAVFGGIVGICLYALMTKKTAQELWRYGDLFALALPLGQAIGRWGNYFNNEIIGKMVKVSFFQSSISFTHPLFFYESALLFFVWIVFEKLANTTLWGIGRGRLMGLYLLIYGGVRFLLEPLRLEYVRHLFQLFSYGQIVGLLAMIVGGIILVYKTITIDQHI